MALYTPLFAIFKPASALTTGNNSQTWHSIADVETSTRFKGITVVSTAMAVVVSMYFASMKYYQAVNFVQVDKEELVATVLNPAIKKEKPKPKPPRDIKRKPIYKKDRLSGAKGGGGGKTSGNPKALVKRGVLAIMHTTSRSNMYAANNIPEKFVENLDKTLSQLNSLKTTGKIALGERRGFQEKGNIQGVGSGPGEDIGGMVGGLLSGGGGKGLIGKKVGMEVRKVKARAKSISMGAEMGGRSKSEVMRVIRRRIFGLRHIYTKYLRANPNMGGKVAVNFKIAPSGSIISLQVTGTSTGVSEFDKAILKKIRPWQFGAIKGGVTTITVPFTFSE